VEQCVDDVRFVSWINERIRVVDVVVLVCCFENASECFAMCGIDVLFVVVDDFLKIELCGP
jgi:hypothetical protein